jgi:hypothetical protein
MVNLNPNEINNGKLPSINGILGESEMGTKNNPGEFDCYAKGRARRVDVRAFST